MTESVRALPFHLEGRKFKAEPNQSLTNIDTSGLGAGGLLSQWGSTISTVISWHYDAMMLWCHYAAVLRDEDMLLW